MTTQTPPPRFEDRLLEALEQHLVKRSAPTHVAAARVARRVPAGHRRRLACAGVPAAFAAVALVVVPSLGGSSPAIAQAAVLRHAAAALDQPDTITYLQLQDYSVTGMGPCFLGLAAPLPCIGAGSATTMSTGTLSTGISADPADDTLTYSSQEWTSPDGSRTRTLYDNGDELVTDAGDDGYAVFDAADDTLTTLTGVSVGAGSLTPSDSLPDPLGAVSPLGVASNVSDPSYYEQLYQEALAGDQSAEGNTTVTAQLAGQTTLAGDSVYELEFTVHFTPSADLSFGDLCGTTVCTLPDQEIQIYLDAQTYMPVRSVISYENSGDLGGVPPGNAVSQVADFSVQSLPDTPANEALLTMSSHAGATMVDETREQYVNNLGASLRAQVATNRTRAAASVRHGARSHR